MEWKEFQVYLRWALKEHKNHIENVTDLIAKAKKRRIAGLVIKHKKHADN